MNSGEPPSLNNTNANNAPSFSIHPTQVHACTAGVSITFMFVCRVAVFVCVRTPETQGASDIYMAIIHSIDEPPLSLSPPPSPGLCFKSTADDHSGAKQWSANDSNTPPPPQIVCPLAASKGLILIWRNTVSHASLFINPNRPSLPKPWPPAPLQPH